MEQYDASVVVCVCTLAKGCTHIYYQRGVFIQFIFLRCSFPIIGIAKALNMERTKVRDSHVFYVSIQVIL